MITTTGQNIIGKYLLGNAPAFASYIAVGCGPQPGVQGSQFVRTISDVWSEYWLVPGFTPNIPIEDGGFNPLKFYIGVLSESPLATTAELQSDLIGTEVSLIAISADPEDAFLNNGRFSQGSKTIITAINNNDTSLDPSIAYRSFTVDSVPEEYLYRGTIRIDRSVDKQALDFEMFRIPISSRGSIVDGGINKLVFTGQLPTEERYEISEIGLYSAGRNSEAGTYDSKTIFSFSDQEDWQLSSGALSVSAGINSSYPIVVEKLTDSADAFTSTVENAIAVRTNSNNAAFFSEDRAARYERCRYLNSLYMIKGSSSKLINKTKKTGTISSTSTTTTITGIDSTADLEIGMKIVKLFGTGAFGGVATITNKTSTTLTISTDTANTAGAITFQSSITDLDIIETATGDDAITTSFLQLNNQSVDFTKNSTSDLIKIAFSVMNRNNSSGNPDSVRVRVVFSNSETNPALKQYAILEAESLLVNDSFSSNRYVVIEKRLDQLKYSSTFSWKSITQVQVYANAIKDLTITNKERTDDVVTLTVNEAVLPGDLVTIRNLGVDLNGTYLITDSTSGSISFNKAGTNIASTAVTGYGEVSTKDFWIAIDAIRFDNISTLNPLYGLVGYSVIDTSETIIKESNTSNYIEFRFALDVL